MLYCKDLRIFFFWLGLKKGKRKREKKLIIVGRVNFNTVDRDSITLHLYKYPPPSSTTPHRVHVSAEGYTALTDEYRLRYLPVGMEFIGFLASYLHTYILPNCAQFKCSPDQLGDLKSLCSISVVLTFTHITQWAFLNSS